MVYFEMIAFYFPIYNTISLQYSWQTRGIDKIQNVNLQIVRFYSLLKLGWIFQVPQQN